MRYFYNPNLVLSECDAKDTLEAKKIGEGFYLCAGRLVSAYVSSKWWRRTVYKIRRYGSTTVVHLQNADMVRIDCTTKGIRELVELTAYLRARAGVTALIHEVLLADKNGNIVDETEDIQSCYGTQEEDAWRLIATQQRLKEIAADNADHYWIHDRLVIPCTEDTPDFSNDNSVIAEKIKI